MIEQVENLYQKALQDLQTAATSTALSEWYRLTLGQKGNVQLFVRHGCLAFGVVGQRHTVVGAYCDSIWFLFGGLGNQFFNVR